MEEGFCNIITFLTEQEEKRAAERTERATQLVKVQEGLDDLKKGFDDLKKGLDDVKNNQQILVRITDKSLN